MRAGGLTSHAARVLAAPVRTGRRLIRLKSRLLLLLLVAIAPLAFACAMLAYDLLEQQRQQTEAMAMDLARALASSVESELDLTVSALQALALVGAVFDESQAGLADAYDRARAVQASRPVWRALNLARPDGRVIFDTQTPLDAPASSLEETASLRAVLDTGAPAVGGMSAGLRGGMGFAVRVPVRRDGSIRYVLGAIVEPQAIQAVIQRQRIPGEWVVSVLDASHVRVARSRAQERFIGLPAPSYLAGLIGQIGESGEVVGGGQNLEGQPVHTAAVQVRPWGWSIALGVPTATAEAALRRSALMYFGGLLLSVLAGSAAAWVVSRSITRPVQRLRAEALALGRGQPLPGDASEGADLAEIAAVSQALAEASQLRQRSEAERDRLLEAERAAHLAADAARRRLQLLAGAGTQLARSLEEKDTLEAIASIVVPGIADICRIDLLDGEGRPQRKLAHHIDPERRRRMLSFLQAHPTPLQGPGSVAHVIATGEAYLRNFDTPADHVLGHPVLEDFVREMEVGAVCLVPLVARGRTIGAMAALQIESGRRFTPEDAALLGELAQRVATALDNVRLFGEARAARDTAEIANRSKDEFMAMLGHELRNPLSPIVTALTIMKKRDEQLMVRERELIERQVRHLSRMVDDLLDVSRIVSGKIQLEAERLDLRDLVHRALELTSPVLDARRSAPEVDLPALPVMVHGDPLRLAQVLCNLLINAAKFTPTDRRIAVVLRNDDTQADLSVIDEGAGIAPDLLPRIFDRFVQGEQPLQRADGGLGLGLAIARSLVELHGGRILAGSGGVGLGSHFRIRLPLARADLRQPAPPAPPALLRQRRLRLLVVDDNDDAARSLATLFRLEGHDARSVGSAEAALWLLDDFLPDAAVLDIGLPGMSGNELAKALRKDLRTRSIVLVALTGYGRQVDRLRALTAGFDEHVAKPVQPLRLLARIQELVD